MKSNEKGGQFHRDNTKRIGLAGAAGAAGAAGSERSHAGGSQPPPNAAGDPKVGSKASPNSLKLGAPVGRLKFIEIHGDS